METNDGCKDDDQVQGDKRLTRGEDHPRAAHQGDTDVVLGVIAIVTHPGDVRGTESGGRGSDSYTTEDGEKFGRTREKGRGKV